MSSDKMSSHQKSRLGGRGLFIVIDGPDGSGKTTQAEFLYSRLKIVADNVLRIREPGGTSIGEQIRKILLAPENDNMYVETEMLLYMASRAQLLREVILPELKKGTIIICERFIFSTIAYQGIAGELGIDTVESVAKIAIDDFVPDLTVILDIDTKEGFKRLKRDLDRIEMKDLKYHELVRKGFLAYAKKYSDKVVVIKSSQPIKKISNKIWNDVKKLI